MNIVVRYNRRSRRLTMRIGRHGAVNVSAPIGTPAKLIEKFVEDNLEWINNALAHQNERENKRDAFFDSLPLKTPAERREATRRLNETVLPLVERYSAEMGVKPTSIRYKAMRTRWGSCQTRTRSIVFSAYLLLLPQLCLELVVVHELAHLLVPNHSKAFYEVMDRHFPRWLEARQTIKKIFSDEI